MDWREVLRYQVIEAEPHYCMGLSCADFHDLPWPTHRLLDPLRQCCGHGVIAKFIHVLHDGDPLHFLARHLIKGRSE
jgi:hypothetical protein